MRALRDMQINFTPFRGLKMKIRGISSGMIRPALAAGIVITTVALPQIARADESGISFWIPGLFGSLAAVPVTPGWSVSSIYYHTSVGASAYCLI